jgi:hypothetical protein
MKALFSGDTQKQAEIGEALRLRAVFWLIRLASKILIKCHSNQLARMSATSMRLTRGLRMAHGGHLGRSRRLEPLGNPYWKTGWNGGWGGWVGPVFWPYFYGDLLAFVLWPYGYYYPFWFDPFWAYGDVFLWDAIFWPYPEYAYARRTMTSTAYMGPMGMNTDPMDIYDDPPRRRVAKVRNDSREITTGSTTNGSDSAQTCGGMVGKRLDVMATAIKTVRPALARFYASLTDEQKARFNMLGPPKTTVSRQG